MNVIKRFCRQLSHFIRGDLAFLGESFQDYIVADKCGVCISREDMQRIKDIEIRSAWMREQMEAMAHEACERLIVEWGDDDACDDVCSMVFDGFLTAEQVVVRMRARINDAND